MTVLINDPPSSATQLADLLERLGGIPVGRVHFEPVPGTAIEQDVLEIHARLGRLCELVDGVLVEKAVGFKESCLAIALVTFLRAFVQPRRLGLIAGESGMMRIAKGLVRIPDVSFVSWSRLPDRRMPSEPIPALAPDLAVEILSPSNTKAEMERKLGEYFRAGVLLVWVIDPVARTVDAYKSPKEFATLKEKDTLDGGNVLPGFSICLTELFAELDQEGPAQNE